MILLIQSAPYDIVSTYQAAKGNFIGSFEPILFYAAAKVLSFMPAPVNADATIED